MKAIRFISLAAVAAMILMVGCTSTRIDPYRPHSGDNNGGNSGSGEGGTTPSTQLSERSDWKGEYIGRTDFTDEYNNVSRVEEFLFTYTGSKYFIARTISEADFALFFDSDAKSLIDGETAALTENDELLNKKTKTWYADILVHGDYLLFLIEVDAQRKPTYSYACNEIEVEQETAVQAYTDWLGTWTVSDGYVGYDIEVSALENNYFYRIDGWETGQAAGAVQMDEDDDWIEARFTPEKDLAFFIQFIASYDDYPEYGKVDYMFVGTYTESTGEKTDDYEGWELARAYHVVGGNAVLAGGRTEFTVNGKTFTPHYDAMRYSLYSYKKDNEGWIPFHDAVPTFKEDKGWEIGMSRTKAASDVDRTPVHTRNYLRRTRLRAHQSTFTRER